MKKFATSALIICAAWLTCSAALSDGVVYVHTARNAPKAVVNGNEIRLESGISLKAENIGIVCEKKQCVYLIFSNRTVLCAKPNSSFKIEKFSQGVPFSFDFDDDIENTRSEISLILERGEFIFFGAHPRPTSKLVIKSGSGVFDVQSPKFVVVISDKAEKISLFDGQSIFKSSEGKTDFLQNKQIGTIVKSDKIGGYPLRIDYLTTIDEDSFKRDFDRCRFVYDSVRFDYKSEKIGVERIVKKEFVMRRAKYEFSR